MSTFNRLKAVMVGVLLGAVMVSGAVILEDNFMSEDHSENLWLKTSGVGTTTVSGGTLAVSTTDNTVEYFHTFNAPKPSTFTITFDITTSNRSGGLMFCRSSGFNGYHLYVNSYGNVQVSRFVNANSSTVANWGSPEINPTGTNRLQVAKNGSTFHVSVNGVHLGTFEDATHSSGDVGFIVFDGVMTFSNFKMTNTFEPDGPRVAFLDNFDNNDRARFWRRMGDGENQRASGTLNVNVDNGGEWAFVNVGLSASLEVSANVSRVSGSGYYGIVLIGLDNEGRNYTAASFAITHERAWAVWRSGQSFSPSEPTMTILGGTATNNIEVKRAANSTTYQFLVNGQQLTTLDDADQNIVGAGVFVLTGNSGSNLSVNVNNFAAHIAGWTSTISWDTRRQRHPGTAVIRTSNPASFNLLGRRQQTTATAAGRVPVRAAGVYISENGREVTTGKRSNRPAAIR